MGSVKYKWSVETADKHRHCSGGFASKITNVKYYFILFASLKQIVSTVNLQILQKDMKLL